MTEIWDIVNENGEYLGITWERKNHDNIPEGMYHPCVEVWVRIKERLLVTQRHPEKSEGLKYDVPGGAVVAGEDARTGAWRELSEEAGISVDPSALIEIGRMTSGNVYAVSYLVKLEEVPSITLQPTEVVGYKLVTEAEMEAMLDDLTRGTCRRYIAYKDKIFPKKKRLNH